jgi:hypothetical protein
MTRQHPLLLQGNPNVPLFPSSAYAIANPWFCAAPATPNPRSAASDLTTASAWKNDNWLGLYLVVDMTIVNGGTATVSVEGYDPVSTKWYAIPGATTTALAAVATTTLLVIPGVVAVANQVVSQLVPTMFRVKLVTAAGAPTLSVNGWLISY